MRALVAIDSFKGSFSSQEAANIVTQAFSKYRIVTDAAAIADGGEGTSAAYLANHSTAMWRQLTVTNMVGKPIPVQYVSDASQHLAIIDVAEASGIQFATTQDGFVDPLTTSSIWDGRNDSGRHPARRAKDCRGSGRFWDHRCRHRFIRGTRRQVLR
ncbi:glycerate kinase [Schleiferilactobacillus harbinensis]|uniref:glycerate kinase n=1 Tax=Schleiferilactobacillus harbinensis TaxID=304207 RepID=UPI001AB0166B|nr:glycerate kinase [Schleiferilactobacillus harbinensis]MBO3092689.1 glycerate kinase [Schleiferilactobacillus harbinensis]